MHDRRRTKIVATLGPATRDPSTVRALIDAGLDVARLNGSHGDHATHAKTIADVRGAAEAADRTVGILFDLQGPKIRIGAFEGEPRPVRRGEEIVIAVGREPETGELPSDYDALDHDVRAGEPLLIDDGTIVTEVVSVEPGSVRCLVHNDGAIAQRKGINLPATDVSAAALSDKDRSDALFAASQGVDLIALSFVREARDLRELQRLLAGEGYDVPLVAKLEKPQALENLDEILAETWGVMVARGDLGVELHPEDVPVAQKRIIRAANRHGRPVITATQMLESMRHNPRPTRAEASDVANAVLDGTDAVMLSAETAAGDYPLESVTMMSRIIAATEASVGLGPGHSPLARRRERTVEGVEEAVADAACELARHINARAIVALTRTGASAVLIAERRPTTPLFAFTPDRATQNRLALVWGVHPHDIADLPTIDERVHALDDALMREGIAAAGEHIVLCMASPRAAAGATNIVLVHNVGDPVPNALPAG